MMSTFSKENLSFVFDKFLQATRIKDLLNPISGIEIFFLFCIIRMIRSLTAKYARDGLLPINPYDYGIAFWSPTPSGGGLPGPHL